MEKYENSTSISGKLCGRNLTLPEYESTNKDMTVLMHSDVNVQDRGFKASYEASLVNYTGLFCCMFVLFPSLNMESTF